MTNLFVICCNHHVFSASSQFCKNIGPTISATITFRNMLEEVVVEVMDGMEKFFKITSYISINSTFDNDDDMTFSNMVKEVVVVVVGEMQKFLQTYLRIETGKPVKKKTFFFAFV